MTVKKKTKAATNSSPEVTQHRWANTGEKNGYRCETCGTPFTRKNKKEPFPETPCVPPVEAKATPAKKFKLHKQLIEYPVPDTTYSLLGPKKGIKPEDLEVEARAQMAERCVELEGKLPQYYDRNRLEIAHQEAAKREALRLEKSRERIAKFKEKRGEEPSKSNQPRVDGGVPLKKICAEINVDPKIARRILRAKGARPSGRWEWPADQVAGVQATIKSGLDAKADKKEAKEDAVVLARGNAQAQANAEAVVAPPKVKPLSKPAKLDDKAFKKAKAAIRGETPKKRRKS